jgi:hypothetical protein
LGSDVDLALNAIEAEPTTGTKRLVLGSDSSQEFGLYHSLVV